MYLLRKNIITFLFVSYASVYGSNGNINYTVISTEELQKIVEKSSESNELTLSMGLELIRRWTSG